MDREQPAAVFCSAHHRFRSVALALLDNRQVAIVVVEKFGDV
jgi:hypothetical protein